MTVDDDGDGWACAGSVTLVTLVSVVMPTEFVWNLMGTGMAAHGSSTVSGSSTRRCSSRRHRGAISRWIVAATRSVSQMPSWQMNFGSVQLAMVDTYPPMLGLEFCPVLEFCTVLADT